MMPNRLHVQGQIARSTIGLSRTILTAALLLAWLWNPPLLLAGTSLAIPKPTDVLACLRLLSQRTLTGDEKQGNGKTGTAHASQNAPLPITFPFSHGKNPPRPVVFNEIGELHSSVHVRQDGGLERFAVTSIGHGVDSDRPFWCQSGSRR